MRQASKAWRLVGDLTRVNHQYLRSPSFRRATMQQLALPSSPLELSGASSREYLAAHPSARPYAGLSGAALSLSCLGAATAAAPTVSLVLSELDPDNLFAGVHTAITAAGKLASELAMPLRIVILSETANRRDRDRVAAAVSARLVDYSRAVDVAFRSDVVGLATHDEDIWVVTHWTTAHAALVASRSGVIEPTQVVYLVQDYEPSFVAASVDSVTAQSTYHEGFHLLVNSTPVAAVLRQREGLSVDDEFVFAPELDLTARGFHDRKGHNASSRTVFFYGRPSKPRNMFTLGVAALRVAAASVQADVRWVSAGEAHPEVALGSGHTLTSVGTLSWSDYFALLSGSQVALSLQATPHPSHPPLEAAARGVRTVTNDVDGTRSNLHPLIDAVPADPQALGKAIVNALEHADRGHIGELAPPELGAPLASCITSLAARLTSREVTRPSRGAPDTSR